MGFKLSALVVTLAVAACSNELHEGMDAANDLMYRRQHAEAADLYGRLLRRAESGKANPQARMLILERLGKLNYLYLRDYTRAAQNYETLVKDFAGTDAALSALQAVADLYRHKLNDPARALDAYQRMIDGYPQRPETRRARLETVAVHASLRNFKEARAQADLILLEHPDTPEALQALVAIGEAWYGQKCYKERIQSYEQLLKQKPAPALAALVLFELGNGYQSLGEGSRALTCFINSLEEHPNPLLVQRKIARIRARLNQTTPDGRILTALRGGSNPVTMARFIQVDRAARGRAGRSSQKGPLRGTTMSDEGRRSQN